jgi:very-short-patch-repair endonuclease
VNAHPQQTTPIPEPATHSANRKPLLDHDILTFARKLRQEHSDPERLMWAVFRDRRFCGFKFRRQHPVKPYVLDFYCHDKKLAIELDGGQHNTTPSRD